MSNLSSSLGTSQPFIPVVNPTQLGKAAGLAIHFPTAAALQTALSAEKANVAGAQGLWGEGQSLSDASMPFGVRRYWNASSPGDAKRVLFTSGALVVLTADTNVVLRTTGAPSSGTGANGDIAFDVATGLVYTKSAGAWDTGLAIGVGAPGSTPIPFTLTPPLNGNFVMAPHTMAGNITVTPNRTGAVPFVSTVIGTFIGDGTSVVTIAGANAADTNTFVPTLGVESILSFIATPTQALYRWLVNVGHVATG